MCQSVGRLRAGRAGASTRKIGRASRGRSGAGASTRKIGRASRGRSGLGGRRGR